MSLHDQKAFLASIHPFELLSDGEMDRCIKWMDIAYYPKDTVLISSEMVPKHFFIVIKGCVQEFSSDELIREYHSQDGFDADALIYETSKNRFVVSEDLICYELTKDMFLKLIEQNHGFKNFYLSDLANKFQTLKQKEYTSELSEFMIARVNDIYLHKPCMVDFDTPLFEAVKLSIEQKSSSIIVKKDESYGIITDYDLKKDVLVKGCNLDILSWEIVNFPLVCIEHDDFLFHALLIFTKYEIKRVGVLKENKIIGLLEQLDLLSFFASHTHLISTKIKRASSFEELKSASFDLVNIVKTLHAKGVKVNYIAKLIAELNAKIYEKLFFMIVPEHLVNDCCLIVMGSEGRAEQIMKTDQDNALIIKDDVDKELYSPYMQVFTEKLIEFGFPECEGNIMVSNPYWCKNFSEYESEIERWLENPEMESYMHLSIFFDSSVITGDEEMLKRLKNRIFSGVKEKDVYMAYFAKAIHTFETPIGIFSHLITKDHKLDLKKGGIFPIVQGVRALCLKYEIDAVTTTKRIKALHNKGILERESASELIEAFDALGTLRLKVHLKQLQNSEKIDNNIDPDTLGKLERDLLKDSFKIVNDFKRFITHHFKVDMIS